MFYNISQFTVIMIYLFIYYKINYFKRLQAYHIWIGPERENSNIF